MTQKIDGRWTPPPTVVCNPDYVLFGNAVTAVAAAGVVQQMLDNKNFACRIPQLSQFLCPKPFVIDLFLVNPLPNTPHVTLSPVSQFVIRYVASL